MPEYNLTCINLNYIILGGPNSDPVGPMFFWKTVRKLVLHKTWLPNLLHGNKN